MTLYEELSLNLTRPRLSPASSRSHISHHYPKSRRTIRPLAVISGHPSIAKSRGQSPIQFNKPEHTKTETKPSGSGGAWPHHPAGVTPQLLIASDDLRALVLWHTLFQATTDRQFTHLANQALQPNCKEMFLVSSRRFKASFSGTRPRATTATNKDSRDVSNPVIQNPAPHQAQDRLLARIPGSLDLEVPCVSNISNPAQSSFHLQKFREYQPLTKVATRAGRRQGSETEVPYFPHRNVCLQRSASLPTHKVVCLACFMSIGQ
ncbi:hypothetical protein CTAM01_04085 [Colletotrichum tamarilloi]|uniref:Uncharacterized protein n=1 Tax=Colletotrichum tamarilloi TaxID=1209934 RepID=A0ABQ9RJC6_9PEZI|nr:uncharacterized protein CTAM01_04085 [Colletotrichum tamarilloi]KAK1504778.1 hypothetical protein CTAM01_04085 [Colletotrichum tamarilloi]